MLLKEIEDLMTQFSIISKEHLPPLKTNFAFKNLETCCHIISNDFKEMKASIMFLEDIFFNNVINENIVENIKSGQKHVFWRSESITTIFGYEFFSNLSE